MDDAADFGGAKMALFLGDALAVIQRDDRPGLPFPGHWDLPGGGREGRESPFECVRRECVEELGLKIERHHVTWHRSFETVDGANWFFVAHLPKIAADRVVFGSEGQRWTLMQVQEYLSHALTIPRFQHRLRIALACK